METRASFRNWLLVAFLCLPIFSFAQYTGGSDDGSSSSTFCGGDLNGSAGVALTIGSVSGQLSFCSFSADVYSITILTGSANSFIWSLPASATITRQIDTPTSSIVSINFGNTSGNISVTAFNSCSSVLSSILSVTAISCNQFFGSANDGFSQSSFCGTNLTGGSAPAITLSTINGSTSFCSQGSDVYSITVTSGIANSFVWSVPSGATIVYALNTPTSSIISVNFGNTAGSISVVATNSCSSATSSALSVSNVACNNYFGGNDDGFTNAIFCGSNLNGGSLGVISLSAISGGATFCFNNSQNYSVNILSGIATSFAWAAPSGGNVIANQNQANTSIASIGFGATNGNVQVTATNGCSTATASIAVTGTNCDLTFGGSNDGFSTAIFCGTDLAGGAQDPITLSAITGTSPYCFNLGQNYSATAVTGLATSFVWTVTVGGGSTSSSFSTTTSSIASISFPGASGTIQLDATNGCFSDSKSLAVTGQSCDITLGGNDDGYTSAIFCSSNLNGGSQGVVSLTAISGSNYCINLGQSYSATALSGNPSSFLWTITAGTGNASSILNNFNSSVASLAFTSGTATVQLDATNGCTIDTKTISLSGINCNTTVGGNDDGFTTGIFCGSNLTGGIVSPIALSALIGNGNFCFNTGQNYSVNVTTGTANSYAWSGPTGAGAYAQQDASISSTASINFVGTNGNVSVTASNGCSTAVATLAVTGINCNTTIGGNNDGFSTLTFCGSNLTGGAIAPLTLSVISGNTTPCFDLGDNYSVTTTGNANSFVWTVPTGASQTSFINTLTSSLSTITFGGSSGTISVTASNPCFSDTKSLLVSGVNCLVARGGANDGFAMAQVINSALPVTLVSFTAKALDNAIELKWVTETEINNDYFEVERSKDGRVFLPIGKVTGAGNSKTVQNYSFVDQQPYQGVSYYRLKQIDFDKRFEYSPTLSVEYNGTTNNFDVLIYPNPTTNSTFNVRFNTLWEGSDVTMAINDVTGKTIFKKTFNVTGPLFIKPTDESLKPGAYLVIFYQAEKKVINRLIIQ